MYERLREHAEAGPDLHDDLARHNVSALDDLLQVERVHQEVLAHPFLGGQAVALEDFFYLGSLGHTVIRKLFFYSSTEAMTSSITVFICVGML
jgi:hypothetical protein